MTEQSRRLSVPLPRARSGESRARIARVVGRRARTTLAYASLLAGAVVAVFPVVWMVSTSLKATGSEFTFPPRIIPSPIAWSNYVTAANSAPFDVYFRNSFAVTGLASLGAVLSAAFVAYGFARLRFFGRDFLFLVLLSTLMLPDIVTLIPRFILFRSLGWYDTLLPLIVPSWFGGGAFYVFLIRQYFMTIPYELEEAARVDGANTLYIFTRIMVPLSGPALAAVAIFSVVSNWNDFLGPLIFTQSPQYRTVALGLRSFLGQYHNDWNLLMAGATAMLIPILILFLTAQKYFIRGVAMTGLAGR
jgi:ABC-type glycerol-3-phosphate transport system permease component